jgi:hypothetical protein
LFARHPQDVLKVHWQLILYREEGKLAKIFVDFLVFFAPPACTRFCRMSRLYRVLLCAA